jgi:hypothetical protein
MIVGVMDALKRVPPYDDRQLAEAGTGRSRCPIEKLPDE